MSGSSLKGKLASTQLSTIADKCLMFFELSATFTSEFKFLREYFPRVLLVLEDNKYWYLYPFDKSFHPKDVTLGSAVEPYWKTGGGENYELK